MTRQQLYAWRTAHGWTAPQAAQLLGISRRHYDRLERGDRRITDTLYRLISALDGASPPCPLPRSAARATDA